VRRKLKLAWLMAGLVCWQIGGASPYAAASMHAPAVAHVAASEGHCHQAADTPSAKVEAPTQTQSHMPPCCKGGGCQGDCLLAPVVPRATPIVVSAHTVQQIDTLRPDVRCTTREPELFRPPI
jgi:hypothetical protein